MASTKKKQDEKHLKSLREMVALPHNKQCFDCHQRGPTYVNMTIGSYVCTACSGLLRGLNPPHRVKSISMASFTPEEMEFLQMHGNEYCRKVWLGLYDNRLGNQAESRDETKVKEFMAQKYERKRYYVAPTDSMKEEARRMNEAGAVVKPPPGTRPLKSLLGENAPKLQVGAQVKPPVSKPAMTSVPSFGSTPQSPGTASLQSTHSTGSNALDLLGDLGGDPFGSTTASAAHSHNTGGFADFGSFGGSVSSQPATFHQSTPLQPLGSAPQSSQAVFNGFPPPPSSAPHAPGAGGDKYSNLSDLFSVSETPEESSIKTGWSSTLSTSGGGGISWNSSSSNSTGGINWGGESNNTSSSGGINWNSQPAASSTSSGGWGGGSTSTSSSSWGGAPVSTQSNGLGAPGNPFLSANVANPFGGGMTATSTSHGQTQQANPFGGQGLGTGFGGFGAPQTQQAGGFGHGQFGAAPGSTGAGFGQFGGVQPANAMPAAGFGQFPTQNGGFGMNTSTSGYPGGQGQMSTAGQASFSSQGFGQAAQGFSGAQQGQHGFGSQGFGAPQVSQQGFGMPQQGYGGQMQQGFGGAGWGGVASAPQANPFMSTAQQYSAPKTGATNPFL